MELTPTLQLFSDVLFNSATFLYFLFGRTRLMTGMASAGLLDTIDRRVRSVTRGVSNLADVFIGGAEMILDPVGTYQSSRTFKYSPASSLGMRGVQLFTQDFVNEGHCWEESYRTCAWGAGLLLGVGASVLSYGLPNVIASVGSLAYQQKQSAHSDHR